MKSISTFEPHLAIRELILLPGAEWQPMSSSWLVAGISAGAAYWINHGCNHELQPGTLLLAAGAVRGTIRSSQLTETKLRFFHVNPQLLAGLATVNEQRWLDYAASQESLAFRLLPAQSPLGEKFARLCESGNRNHLVLRVQLLLLFLEALGPELRTRNMDSPAAAAGARGRLMQLLNQTSASELMRMNFEELARAMCCTPRHLSRTFHDLVGISFRQKQADIRLNRAQELLATTRSKVLDVALESGYQSLSLFNLMFKRRFGMTPAQWRMTAAKPERNLAHRERKRSHRVAGF